MKTVAGTRHWRLLVVVVTACTAGGLWLLVESSDVFRVSPKIQALGQQLPTAPMGGDEFNPIRVLPQHRALTKPRLLIVDEVKDQVRDNELVLGVVVGNEARAFPINMLTGPSREIVNDTLAGLPIAATW